MWPVTLYPWILKTSCTIKKNERLISQSCFSFSHYTVHVKPEHEVRKTRLIFFVHLINVYANKHKKKRNQFNWFLNLNEKGAKQLFGTNRICQIPKPDVQIARELFQGLWHLLQPILSSSNAIINLLFSGVAQHPHLYDKRNYVGNNQQKPSRKKGKTEF